MTLAKPDGEPTWSVGDVGPGGGVVFFAAEERHWWGRYLEAAPKGWASGAKRSGAKEDPKILWCSDVDTEVDTGLEMGWGAVNTWRVIEVAGPASAAWAASAYRGGGYRDWFLPSAYELQALFEQCDVVDGLDGDDDYWSSSQDHGGEHDVEDGDFLIQDGALVQDGVADNFDEYACRVRPVRAF